MRGFFVIASARTKGNRILQNNITLRGSFTLINKLIL